MCVGEFACQSRSSATVCVCPVVVQCYCSMELTPTSATPTASPPWIWPNPPPRPCSQVSFPPVCVSSVKHTHTQVRTRLCSVCLALCLRIACLYHNFQPALISSFCPALQAVSPVFSSCQSIIPLISQGLALTLLDIQSCVRGCTFSLFHSSVTIHGSEVCQCLLSFLMLFLSPLTPLLAEAALTNQLLNNLALSCWRILVAIVSLPSIPAFSLSRHETLRNNQRHSLHPIDHTLPWPH